MLWRSRKDKKAKWKIKRNWNSDSWTHSKQLTLSVRTTNDQLIGSKKKLLPPGGRCALCQPSGLSQGRRAVINPHILPKWSKIKPNLNLIHAHILHHISNSFFVLFFFSFKEIKFCPLRAYLTLKHHILSLFLLRSATLIWQCKPVW